MTKVALDNVVKRFGRFTALDHVSFTVESGEIFTLLGPSGCGKTTTLRVIAGFENPDEGKVYFDGEDVTPLKPYERGTAMVFQNYALWPHMKVYDNVAYGLKIRKLSPEEIRRRVKWALELVGLSGLEDRYPHQLSGGQQQRVALARALVVEPRVLLLDEPLSNLDAHLRLRMREELVSLQKRLGITTIYVTHDQEEALSISDRIAVMNKGKIEQVGTPEEIYNKPTTLFTATFIGRVTVIEGVITKVIDNALVELKGGDVILRGFIASGTPRPGARAKAVVKMENIHYPPEPGEANRITGRVVVSMYLGWRVHVTVETREGVRASALVSPRNAPKRGDIIELSISPEDTLIFVAD
ncbi:MAG: ABC transporter ATP-binding protein [Desulfurococcales archaeon]|nr:ABC transporter ATP-binding protein [Desulfurococcales archaeon]